MFFILFIHRKSSKILSSIVIRASPRTEPRWWSTTSATPLFALAPHCSSFNNSNDLFVVQAGKAVVSEITAAGGKAILVKGDVSNAADVTGLFDAAVAAYGKVDILVNNAGCVAECSIH